LLGLEIDLRWLSQHIFLLLSQGNDFIDRHHRDLLGGRPLVCLGSVQTLIILNLVQLMTVRIVRSIVGAKLLQVDATWTSIVVSSHLFAILKCLMLLSTSIQKGICVVVLVEEGTTP